MLRHHCAGFLNRPSGPARCRSSGPPRWTMGRGPERLWRHTDDRSTRGDTLILIRQTEHAVLSGAMAVRWGNRLFAPPEPRESVVLGIDRHDNGWEEWDAAPGVDPVTGSPWMVQLGFRIERRT